MCKSNTTTTTKLFVEPALAVGIKVKGQAVISIVKGSQAEKIGVKLGWLLTHVAGKRTDNSSAITAALAAGKRGGKRYSLTFRQVPAQKQQPPLDALDKLLEVLTTTTPHCRNADPPPSSHFRRRSRPPRASSRITPHPS